MRVYYDWEFLEDGETIDPISVGFVADDGREYYAVFEEIQSMKRYYKILDHTWVMKNVIRHLPLVNYGDDIFTLDRTSSDVKTFRTIKAEVREFLDSTPDVELWGYYAAYDHVRLAQMFGPMVNKPASMPMFTHDITQVLSMHGIPECDWLSYLPPQPENAHNALADARWTRDAVNMVLDLW